LTVAGSEARSQREHLHCNERSAVQVWRNAGEFREKGKKFALFT
jgi:hypothetical protein